RVLLVRGGFRPPRAPPFRVPSPVTDATERRVGREVVVVRGEAEGLHLAIEVAGEGQESQLPRPIRNADPDRPPSERARTAKPELEGRRIRDDHLCHFADPRELLLVATAQ